MRTIWLYLCALALITLNTTANAASGNLAVVELFTSQSCSISPKADAIFRQIELEHRSNVIALSCHVAITENESPEDTELRKLCTDRQTNYYRAINLPLSTPQMVINGMFSNNGLTLKTVDSGIKMAQAIGTVTPLQVNLREDALDISLPKMSFDKPVQLWLFGYRTAQTISIKTGANSGKTVEYVNQVGHVTELMNWDGEYMNFSYPLEETGDLDGYAVIAQYTDFSDIVAAGKTGTD